MTPYIRELHHRVRHHLTLDREVPLINLRNGSVVLGVVGTLPIEPGWILRSRRVGQWGSRNLGRAVVVQTGSRRNQDLAAISTQEGNRVNAVGVIGQAARR